MHQPSHHSSQLYSSSCGLNAPQRQAVKHLHGPALIFAGAGSGKTRIIVHRIVQLIEVHKVRPGSICALTFTNKAAREMQDRAVALHAKCRSCHIATFHSAAARWLRDFAPLLGFENNFSILDSKDAQNVVKKIFDRYIPKSEKKAPQKLNIWQASALDQPTITANHYHNFIQKLKMQGLTPDAPAVIRLCKDQEELPFCHKIYKEYQKTLKQNHCMDFSDLLLHMLTLLRSNEEVKNALTKRYRFFLVDEYQDVNPTQFELLNHLTPEPRNLMVVGDDDQSIYSWRGADPSNILNFQSSFKNSTIIHLDQNYRSTGHIVKAAKSLISNNAKRAKKNLWTDAAPGPRIELIKTHNGSKEAAVVCQLIHEELHQYAYSDMAIFYRTNAQSRELEDCFNYHKIPYKIYGSLRFYDRTEIKDILAYFRLAVNPKDDSAFLRLIKTPPRGLGAKSLETLSSQAHLLSLSIYEVMEIIYQNPKNTLFRNLSARLIHKSIEIYSDISELNQALLKAPLKECMATFATKVPYLEYLKSHYPDLYQDKLENTQELGAAIAAYASSAPHNTLAHWLQDISLLGSEQEDVEGVSMMTLHASKGLEYARVFITGCDDGLLPHAGSRKSEQLEEERRLFYVGMTRAKEKLTLTTGAMRRVYNDIQCYKPSRFLKEIPEDILESLSVHNLEARHL